MEHDPSREPDPVVEGNALRRIHEALASFDRKLPRMYAAAEVPAVLRVLASRGSLARFWAPLRWRGGANRQCVNLTAHLVG